MFCLWEKGRAMKVFEETISENIQDDTPEETSDDSLYVKIMVKIYKADGIPLIDSGIMAQVRKTFSVENVELLDPYVQVFFGGLKGSTSKKKHTMTPYWDQQIVFMMEFPLPPYPMVVQLRDDEIMLNNVVGSTVIHMDKISNSGSGGFLPTFGPCYMYLGTSRDAASSEAELYYKGRIQMAISTEIVTNPNQMKPYVFVEPTAPLPEGTCGFEVEFLLFVCLRDVTMIDKKVAEKKRIRFTLQIGHVPQCSSNSKQCFAKKVLQKTTNTSFNLKDEDIDNRETTKMYGEAEYCSPFMTPSSTNRKYYHLPVYESKPCLWLKSTWPDCRRRMYISNVQKKISQQVELCLNILYEYIDIKSTSNETKVRSSLQDLDNSMTYFLKLLKENWEFSSTKTQLDKERSKMYENCLGEIIKVTTKCQISLDRSNIKVAVGRFQRILQELKNIEEDPQPALPDVVVWMENNQKRIGYSRIVARDLLHATNEAERGEHCGKIRSLFFKAFSKRRSEAVMAKLDVYLWLGLSKHIKYCLNGLPQGFDIDFGEQDVEQIHCIPRVLTYYERQVYQLQAHIYQARSIPWFDMSKYPSPFAQLFVGNKCLCTQIRENTLNPIWDETLIFSGLVFYGNRDEMSRYPLDVVIEIHNFTAQGKSSCLSRGVVPVSIEDSDKKTLPLLKWYDVVETESEDFSQILAAFELNPMPEAAGDVGAFGSQYYDIAPVMEIPASIRPRFTAHRMEILFWGLRELKRVRLMKIEAPRLELQCGGSVIRSSIITNYKKHSNFIKMMEVIDMDLPEREAYFPALTIRLQDCRSFGRRNLVASHVINCLQKYVVKVHGQILKPKFDTSAVEMRNQNEERDVSIDIESSEEIPFCDSFIIQKVHIPWTYSKAHPELNSEGEEVKEDWWSRYSLSTEDRLQNKKSSFQRKGSFLPMSSTTDYPHTAVDFSRVRAPKMSLIPDQNFESLIKVSYGISTSNSMDSKAFIVYPCELENVSEFGGFEEWLHSFELTRGRKFTRHNAEKTAAIFKGCFRIYELPLPPLVTDPFLPVSDTQEGLFHGLPENKPTKVLVRLYVVKAINLTPSDVTNTTDAYIAVQLGKQRFSDKDNYISKQLNPVFGRCFEFVANFPTDSMIVIQVMDWDLLGSDDLIGETKIDLENRFYSRHRATCGLPRTYETSGPNAWRDVLTPLEILTKQCQDSGLGTPHVTDKDIRIANIVYDFDENSQDEKASEQNRALYLLHRWQDISPGKYSLVPEHLEARTLYHPSKPGEPQGKLVMWLDTFPENTVPPSPPRDISVRKPTGYELRVIIWNTDEVILSDDAFLTGEKMSDIYVKGWLTGKDAQCTDVHYRSLTGEGNFNWRFVFPFNYLPIERQMVVTKKVSIFSWDETEFKIPPHLKLQIWDADHFKPDDFLGELTLDLHRFPRAAKTVSQCSLEMLKDDDAIPQISLFKHKRIRGWWPVFAKNKIGEKELTGKVEAELHLLTAEEAETCPVGLGRKEPDSLQKPKRPDTSFANFLHPLKTFRYVFWKNYRKQIITGIVLIALILFFALFVYSAPGYTAKRILGA